MNPCRQCGQSIIRGLYYCTDKCRDKHKAATVDSLKAEITALKAHNAKLASERVGYERRYREAEKRCKSLEAFATAEIEKMQTQIDAAQTRIAELEAATPEALSRQWLRKVASQDDGSDSMAARMGRTAKRTMAKKDAENRGTG